MRPIRRSSSHDPQPKQGEPMVEPAPSHIAITPRPPPLYRARHLLAMADRRRLRGPRSGRPSPSPARRLPAPWPPAHPHLRRRPRRYPHAAAPPCATPSTAWSTSTHRSPSAPAARHPRLNSSAQGWTNEMVHHRDFTHGADFAARITAAGFDWSTSARTSPPASAPRLGRPRLDGEHRPLPEHPQPPVPRGGHRLRPRRGAGGRRGTWTLDFGLRWASTQAPATRPGRRLPLQRSACHPAPDAGRARGAA